MRTIVLLAILAAAVFRPPAAGAQASDYVVGPRDVLAITVSNEPTLSGKFTVVSDGTFTYPLIGPAKAGGLSVRAVERELMTKLADGLSRKTGGQRRARSVRQPARAHRRRSEAGRQLSADRTHDAARSAAHRGRDRAHRRTDALVVRGGASRGPGAIASGAAPAPPRAKARARLQAQAQAMCGGSTSKPCSAATSRRTSSSRPGDMVFVPRAEPPTPVYVTGLVRSPGSFQLPKRRDRPAGARAGGRRDRSRIDAPHLDRPQGRGPGHRSRSRRRCTTRCCRATPSSCGGGCS